MAKKKFKDTKFGNILIKAIPSAGELIGNLLPDKGVLGIAKNLITNSDKSDEEKQELLAHHREMEKEYLADVQNARDNETQRDTSVNATWLSKNIHELIAIAVVGAWVITWWIASAIPQEDIRMAVMLILGYLYGRTKPQK